MAIYCECPARKGVPVTGKVAKDNEASASRGESKREATLPMGYLRDRNRLSGCLNYITRAQQPGNAIAQSPPVPLHYDPSVDNELGSEVGRESRFNAQGASFDQSTTQNMYDGDRSWAHYLLGAVDPLLNNPTPPYQFVAPSEVVNNNSFLNSSKTVDPLSNNPTPPYQFVAPSEVDNNDCPPLPDSSLPVPASGYLSPDCTSDSTLPKGLNRHEQKKHGAEKKTGGRPPTCSRKLD
ncbi:hypothetical protein AlacWU_03844 [Aspergillus niger]|nr:hypothetical protein AlacWU_03844 [Aspergillus niger]